MKIAIKTLLLLLFAASISVTACKKDDDDKTKREILTEKSCWGQTKSETLNPGTGQWIVDNIDPCTADDCTSFRADGVLTLDEGATKCDPTDPQTISGTWVLSADEQSLTLNQGGSSFTFTVIELTENKLVLEGNILGFQVRVTFEPK